MYPAKSPILSGFFAAQKPFFKVSNEVYPMSRTILNFRGVGRLPFCYTASAFTRREDRATLGSDLSALRGLAKGEGVKPMAPLLTPFGKQKR